MTLHQSINDRLSKANPINSSHESIWEPIKGTSQELALDTRCHHTLYHGARGPGKTITQLMRFRRLVGKGYGPFWRGIILDFEFKNLSDLVAQSKRFFTKFDDGARFLSSASEYKWTWDTGEELFFRHAKTIADYDNFHGHEYPFIGWNELTKYPTGELYEKMTSTNRSSFNPEKDTPHHFDDGRKIYDTDDGWPLPPIPLEVFSTTNPNGAGHNWVKLKFITPVKNGQVLRVEVPVFNPQTQQDEVIEKTQVSIFGSYRENKFLPPEYVAELEQITDPNLKAAWLHGSWDVNAGGAFDDLFERNTHIIPKFNIPDGWRIDRAFDWGSSHPFSVGWFAEANGEEVTLSDGSTFSPAKGSIIQINEWYGAELKMVNGVNQFGNNKGLKMSASDIAVGISQIEAKMLNSGFITTKPLPGPADNQIRDVREADVDTIESKMADKGIRWVKSDKSPGSRKIGFQLLRDRLEASVKKEGAGIYFMNNCIATTSILPSLPRDDKIIDDVNTHSEDHIYDMIRYKVLMGANRLAKKIDVSYAR